MPLMTNRATRAISVTARKSVAHHGSLSRNHRYSSTPFTGMATTPARRWQHYLTKEVNHLYCIGNVCGCKLSVFSRRHEPTRLFGLERGARRCAVIEDVNLLVVPGLRASELVRDQR